MAFTNCSGEVGWELVDLGGPGFTLGTYGHMGVNQRWR